MTEPLSAVVITYNEADRIAACLDSLAFCDELIVVDSFSTDDTVAIATARGARVVQRAFDGYRSQKTFAASLAAHHWILSLDADERVDATLRASIEAERARGFADVAGYRFARMSEYFGRFLRHGNAYPNRILRLFDRRRGGWRGTREVHEGITLEGPERRLDGHLVHYPYRDLNQMLVKTQRYARMMAEHDHARGKRMRLHRLVLSPPWRFLRGYVLRLGFLDGMPGLVYAYVRANYVRQKAIMLWLLQTGQPPGRD